MMLRILMRVALGSTIFVLASGCAVQGDAGEGGRGAPAAVDVEATGGRGVGGSPAALCRAGCDRLDACNDELLDGDVAAIERCHRECTRLDEGRREGMGTLRVCLEAEGCEAFAACLRDPETPGIDPAPEFDADPKLTNCERVCGGFADCSIATERASADGAARLEMRCLSRCLMRGEPASAPSAYLACADAERCSEVIACVQAVAPGEVVDGDGSATAGGVGQARPCEVICARIVECFASPDDLPLGGEMTPDKLESQCVAELCSAPSNPSAERQMASCAAMAECSEVMACFARGG